MKIQYASDIHLELSDNSRFIKSMPFEVAGDVLVFAGDTGYLRDRTLPNLKFWKWASANYREVLLVPGNHEFMAMAMCWLMAIVGAGRFFPMSITIRIKWYALMIQTSSFQPCGHTYHLKMNILSVVA